MPSPDESAGYNPGPWIARRIREGFSARSSLEEWRSMGFAIRDSRWYAQWRTIRGSIERAGEVANLPAHRIPGEEMFTPWATARAGRWAYQVNVNIFDIDSQQYMTQPTMVMYDRRVSIAKAIRDAFERIDEAYDEQGEYEGFRVHSAQIANLYYTTEIP